MNEAQKKWVKEKQVLIRQAHNAGCSFDEVFLLASILSRIAKNNREVITSFNDVLEQIEKGDL